MYVEFYEVRHVVFIEMERERERNGERKGKRKREIEKNREGQTIRN